MAGERRLPGRALPSGVRVLATSGSAWRRAGRGHASGRGSLRCLPRPRRTPGPGSRACGGRDRPRATPASGASATGHAVGQGLEAQHVERRRGRLRAGVEPGRAVELIGHHVELAVRADDQCLSSPSPCSPPSSPLPNVASSPRISACLSLSERSASLTTRGTVHDPATPCSQSMKDQSVGSRVTGIHPGFSRTARSRRPARAS
jgi:hypothetical protein